MQACLACNVVPEARLADRVIDADAVVLMREDAGHPFRYAVVQVLKGVADNLPPPPFLIPHALPLHAKPHPLCSARG